MVKESRLYDLLSISPEATAAEVKKAYRTSALRYHPDKLKDKDEETQKKGTELFQELTHAYEVLSDTEQRQIYDVYGEAALESNVTIRPTGEQAGMFSPEQLFGQLFGDSFGGSFPFGGSFSGNGFGAAAAAAGFRSNRHRHHHHGPRKGRDIHHTMYCSVADFYNGTNQKLRLTRRVMCPSCGGSGGQVVSCSTCNGAGMFTKERRTGGVFHRTSMTCQSCGGMGEFIPQDQVCTKCHGQRLLDQTTILTVNVPRGAQSGINVVLPNMADEGIDIVPGDVIVRIVEEKQPHGALFSRRGDDLLTTVRVPLHKALCGGPVALSHLGGQKISMYLNPGDLTAPGQVKVIKNQGMPICQEDGEVIGYGDLFVRFEVALPQMSQEQCQAMKGILLGGVSEQSSEADMEDIEDSQEDNVHYLQDPDGAARCPNPMEFPGA